MKVNAEMSDVTNEGLLENMVIINRVNYLLLCCG